MFGYFILYASKRHIVSIDYLPLSTKSPINRNLFIGGGPPAISKSLSIS